MGLSKQKNGPCICLRLKLMILELRVKLEKKQKYRNAWKSAGVGKEKKTNLSKFENVI